MHPAECHHGHDDDDQALGSAPEGLDLLNHARPSLTRHNRVLCLEIATEDGGDLLLCAKPGGVDHPPPGFVMHPETQTNRHTPRARRI
jgi:hypothetical protein